MNRVLLSHAPFLALFLFTAFTAQAQSLTPEEKRGQKIYLTGKSPEGGELTAFLGDSETPIPAHLFACVNCHGPDGKGVPEGGVKPSNITWHELSNPYGAVSEKHRVRAPYTEKQLLRVFKDGVDSSGNRLETSMPRYHFEPGDARALIAYLKKIDRIQDPGVTSGRIRVGVILPPAEPDPAGSAAIRATLRTYFDSVNREGGIYRREIELVTLELEEEPAARTGQWARMITDEGLFALLAPGMEGVDPARIDELIAETSLLVISPLRASPPRVDIPNPNVFYFYPGVEELARALRQFARKKLKQESDPAVILGAASVVSEELAATAIPILEIAASVDPLEKSGVTSLLVVGDPEECERTLDTLSRARWSPIVLLPGSSLSEAVIEKIAGYEGDVYAAFPNRGAAIAGGSEETQKSALVAADVFRSLLLQAGRRLTRRKVVELLEKNHERETGWTGPLSFGPNRRLGARGAFIGKFEQGTGSRVSETEWIELED